MKKNEVVCGIDVSSEKLDICTEARTARRTAIFENTPSGHNKLITHLTRRGRYARVVLEATGVYSFELSMALHRARRVEVMVVNPRSSSDFTRALMNRSKSDAADAAALLEYAKRMPFVEWTPPSDEVLELQRITRLLRAQVTTRTQEINRLHAASRTPHSEVIQAELQRHIDFLDESGQRLRDQALEIVAADPDLDEMYRHLTSVKGIAVVSGLTLLAELASLPEDMSPRQWVAHAGLDPRHFDSGSSVSRKVRISKNGNVHLRAALYMPAQVAARHEPAVRAFYQELIGRDKKPMVAIVAVMRKLLHALHGMLHTKTDFNGAKFRPSAGLT